MILLILFAAFATQQMKELLYSTHTTEAQTNSKMYGVNISGAEFGDQNLPGEHGKHYIYQNNQDSYNYFAQRGQGLIRIPFRWERIQPQAYGNLSEFDIQQLKLVLDQAQTANQKVILDLHNYGRYYNAPMKKEDASKLANVWRKIAEEVKNHPALFGYEIMNEPHDLPEGSDSWAYIAQEVTNEIRKVDTSHPILIPGYSWQSARFWRDNNENLNITDPSNNILYAAHLYFDNDYSGSYNENYDAEGATPQIGRERVQPFLQWLNDKNKKGIMTEYGIPGNDTRWNTVLDNFMNEINKNSRIVGGTYWAAGPWWGDYPLSVEPQGTQDKPQMSVLTKYKSSNPPPTPTPTMSPAVKKQGDTNNDTIINIQDYNILVSEFHQTGDTLTADFNKSGKVDIQDYNILVTFFGK